MKRGRKNEIAQAGVGNQISNCRLSNLSETSLDPDSQLDPNIVSYAAAVSIILGSKLHESNGELTLVRREQPSASLILPLTSTPCVDHSITRSLTFPYLQASFQDFEIESLKHFERFVLKKLLFCISPQVTPFAFIRKFLQIWDPVNENSELTRIEDSLVADFWEGKTVPSNTFTVTVHEVAISGLVMLA